MILDFEDFRDELKPFIILSSGKITLIPRRLIMILISYRELAAESFALTWGYNTSFLPGLLCGNMADSLSTNILCCLFHTISKIVFCVCPNKISDAIHRNVTMFKEMYFSQKFCPLAQSVGDMIMRQALSNTVCTVETMIGP